MTWEDEIERGAAGLLVAAPLSCQAKQALRYSGGFDLVTDLVQLGLDLLQRRLI